MNRTRAVTLCAMLTALALALSFAERLIPLEAVVPLPGVKLGLANIVTMFALYQLGARYALAVLVCRCALSSLLWGGPTALWFSLAGGLLALGAMALAKRAKFLSVYGVSLCGAACHNLGQILAAMAVLRSVSVASYLPFLLVVSVFTGLLTGAAASSVFRALSHVPRAEGGEK